ncbi:hypothetical protein SDC9_94325 [bioreactor metagenome]|uniref:Uncharacterized protein n=1 Tax=bioreactor metagenome TaxID=1076179 RepID=A0A645AD69_9ZZZZ
MTYHIYTGYQWRPMKDDELEIMCKENIVPFKSKYPEAGEIVEEDEEDE